MVLRLEREEGLVTHVVGNAFGQVENEGDEASALHGYPAKAVNYNVEVSGLEIIAVQNYFMFFETV